VHCFTFFTRPVYLPNVLVGRRADLSPFALLPLFRQLPNDFLSLRPEIHHMCMTFLPSSPGSSPSTTHSTHHIATGTSSGHVRTYDVRAQRRPVNNWKAHSSSTGGISRISAGRPQGGREGDSGGNGYEIWFSESDSGKVGCLDSRTGRVLYAFSSSTSTPSHLLPLSSSPALLASLSSDSLLSVYRTLPLPPNAKQTPLKGKMGVSVGGCEGGVVVGWEGEPWDGVRDERKEREEREEEEVWEGMQIEKGAVDDSDDEGTDGEGEDMEDGVVVTVQDDASEEEGSDEEEEEQKPKPKAKKAKKGGKR
jgi:ribosome biogenesis protein NSA1